MRVSQFLLSTLKEAPAEADIVSQRLMLRSGMIKKLGAGIYTWMPLGLRVLRKVEAIVREEMNRAGAIELLMPAVQPAELWQETGRWDEVRPEMLKIKDRHERDFIVGPTHEEVITDIVRKEITQLPPAAGQLLPDPDQVPRRDPAALRRDARARVRHEGRLLVRRRQGRHAASYQAMYDAYTRIFTRLGLKFRAVAADTGAIGGSASHEFQVLADSGEDAIAWCPASDYAANVELAEAVAPAPSRPAPAEADAEGADAPAWRPARRSRRCSGCRCRARSSASCSPPRPRVNRRASTCC